MGAATMDPPKGREGLAEVPPPRGMEDGGGTPEGEGEGHVLPDGKQVAVDDLIVDGSGQLGFDVGGKTPTSATLTLTGGKIEIEGQFEKGEIVDLHIQARVNDVGFKDNEDSKTGQVVGCERRQKARIISVERTNG